MIETNAASSRQPENEGGGGQKGGKYIPYYGCPKRFNQHECKQDYVRAELLESAIVQDIKAMFRDEDFMARVWAEANRRLGAEKPDIEKEIARVEAEATKVRASVERYFEAFEAGTLKAELCNRKVQDLHDRLEQLDAEKRELEARRERLELPAIDREMLSALVDNFEQVIAEGPNAQKKDLLRRLVKKILVHDRRTIEIWYGLPNARGFEHWNKNLPECNSIRTASASPQGRFGRPRWAEPEVVFRIVHVPLDDGFPPTDGLPPPSYRDQAVEIALGPNPTFPKGSAAALTRRVPPDQVVNAVPPSRRKRRAPRPSKRVGPPRVVETLRKAIEWRRQLDAGEAPNQAAIARREGISRARVTQILGLLRLPSEVRSRLLTTVEGPRQLSLSEHTLRRLVTACDLEVQLTILRTTG
jgi:hypothetical protein